jgi:hypothetical protein
MEKKHKNCLFFELITYEKYCRKLGRKARRSLGWTRGIMGRNGNIPKSLSVFIEVTIVYAFWSGKKMLVH